MTAFEENINVWLEDGNIIKSRYQEKIKSEGVQSPKSLGERTDAREWAFFHELLNNFSLKNPISILDVGCGKGELINYINNTYPDNLIKEYLGVDIVPEFIGVAISDHPNHKFKIVNFVDPNFAVREKFDLVFALGVLVSRVHSYESYLDYFIKKMLSFSNKYVAFNFISGVVQDSPNYINSQKIAHSTSVDVAYVQNILKNIKNIKFRIVEKNIFNDAKDTFVQIEKME